MVIPDQLADNAPQSQVAHELNSRLASPLHRFAAFVIDYYIIVWPLLLLVISPIVHSMKLSMMSGDDYETQMAMFMTWIIGGLFVLFYQGVCISLWGATLGMKILKLQVVNIWDPKTHPSFVGAFSRAFFWLTGFLFCGVPFLGVFADPRRRAFHDRALNTIVVTSKSDSAVQSPTLNEIAIARTCVWIFVAVIMFSGFSVLVYEMKKGKVGSSEPLSSGIGEDSHGCEDLEQAYQNWPQENGEVASKLSVAMALYAAEQLERECLEKEARNPFLDERDLPLSYLAKSFIHADNQELSDLYLEQVCQETDKKNEDCILAQVIEAMSAEDYAAIDQKFSELSVTGRVHSRVWALRQYLREERYEEAYEFLDSLPDDKTLGRFTAPSRVKILWGMKESEAARVAARTVYETLPNADKATLSSWMCFEEMSQSCELSEQKSCQVFTRAAEQDDRIGRELLPALTLFKLAECSESKATRYSDLLQTRLHPDVKSLVEISLENNQADLRKMLVRAEPYTDIEEDVAYEAAIVLAETSQADADMNLIQEVWQQKNYGLRWEQIGLKLFSFWQTQKNWLEATKVAEKLAGTLREPEFLQDYAVALYKAGQLKKATDLVVDIEDMNMRGQPGRLPASQDDYEELVKLVEGEKE